MKLTVVVLSTPHGELLERAGVELLWFDSMGAKCFSIAVKTREGVILIDPGAAEMQPSYPLPLEEKLRLRRECIKVLESWARRAHTIIVTHYHYDHHVLPSDSDVEDSKSYWLNARNIVLKNPNKYINESQWERARLFLSELLALEGLKLEDYMAQPEEQVFEDPVERLQTSTSKSFGDYQRRREELLAKGRLWFKKLVEDLWSKAPWVKELALPSGARVLWGDGRRLEVGGVVVEVFNPWFHGLEYDRTGWVTPILIRSRGYRIFYSSDLMGPIIEDYAEHIAKLKPDVVLLDGPPTYLFPYMFNRINLERAVENALVVLSSKPRLMIYDHHLLRERRWRTRVSRLFEEAERLDVPLLTGAECLGLKPLIDTL